MSVKVRWIRKWDVPSDTEYGKSYTVSQAEDGHYGCSCPVWKFRRQECKHIAHVKMGYGKERGV